MSAVPKPTPAVKEPKPLQSKPHRIPVHVRNQVLAAWFSTCAWCQQPGGALDLHHVIRRSQGGKDTPANLRPLHRLCHERVHASPAESKAAGFLA